MTTTRGAPPSRDAITGAGGPPVEPSRWIETLYPGYFAMVMASGIVSTGLFSPAPALSAALYAAGLLGFAVLLVAYALRAIRFPRLVLADLSSHARGFGFFTLVAGANVLAVRTAESGWRAAGLGFAVFGVVTWALLSYGVPVLLLTRGARGESAARGVNGTWLIWVVATQSVATTASLYAEEGTSTNALGDVAVAFWSVGAVLYLVLISVIVGRLFLQELTAAELSPPYWITMGATAITVLAGARIVNLHEASPMLAAALPVVRGLTLVLWAFGTWWVPLLLLLGIWRYTRPGMSLGYDAGFWSVVFPLGMYSVATTTLGAATGIGFMTAIGDAEIWVAFAAWLAVFAGMVLAIATSLRRRAAARPSR